MSDTDTDTDPVADVAAPISDDQLLIWATKVLCPPLRQLINHQVRHAVEKSEYQLKGRIRELEKELRELRAAIRNMAAAA
jgi:hypothetical protein